jgi:hypothetical protein
MWLHSLHTKALLTLTGALFLSEQVPLLTTAAFAPPEGRHAPAVAIPRWRLLVRRPNSSLFHHSCYLALEMNLHTDGRRNVVGCISQKAKRKKTYLAAATKAHSMVPTAISIGHTSLTATVTTRTC